MKNRWLSRGYLKREELTSATWTVEAASQGRADSCMYDESMVAASVIQHSVDDGVWKSLGAEAAAGWQRRVGWQERVAIRTSPTNSNPAEGRVLSHG